VTTTDLNALSAAQQIKAVVIQNNNWDTSKEILCQLFIREMCWDDSAEK
jgi:hypothetical protein